MPLTLGFTTQHPGRHRRRTRQKLFQALDAVQSLFLHIDHHAK